MENFLKVSNIQKVCFHDGPGIRTTIFLKGCSLKCPWCANPEASFVNKKYIINENCKYKNNDCKYNIKCNSNKDLDYDIKKCPLGAIEKIYDDYTINELNDIILKDAFLYGTEGGVTFSGGEPLLQSKELAKLMTLLKNNKINIAVESCMYVNNVNLQEVIDYIDLFIIDLKILDEKNSKEILKGDLNLFYSNIETVFSKNKNVIFRIPLISPYITNNENLEEIYNFLNKYKPLKVEIFKGHNLAKEKYKKLGLDYNVVETIDDNEINTIKEKIESLDINIEIITF